MFRMFGFPVHVRPGFVMFMLLIVVLNGGELGLWLAAAIAVLTLVHELGHAMAARRAGARAEISLDFLAGYAAYVPTRPISPARHAWISFAGPAVQIVASVGVLLAMGADPLEPSSVDDSAATLAIWWAGPVIGMLNLIPVLPLDGGNIVLNGLERVLPGRARRVMLYFSIVVTGAGAVACFASVQYRFLAVFIAFLMITQFQMLGATRPPTSPWHDAHEAIRAGKARTARRILQTALTQPRPNRPPPVVQLSNDDIAALVGVLPDPLPSGDPWNEYVLANLLIRLGRYEDAAHYAAESYGRHPHTLGAATVARAAGALGDQATAIGWLRAAAESGTSPDGLRTIIDESPELIGLRLHPDVVAIRRSLLATP